MAEKIEFTNNYSDHSTKKGFQFEFHCNRCGSGYRSEFKTFAMGTISEYANLATGLIGSLFGSAADKAAHAADKLSSAQYQKAHDEAFIEAMNDIKPEFIQCPRCSSWVCRKACWNIKKGLCKQCAPDLGVEMAAAQASKSVEEVWAHAAMAEEDKKLGTEYWREGIKASCPKCETPLATNAKFCPNCGENLKVKDKCPDCGTVLTPNAKFCPECGKKMTE